MLFAFTEYKNELTMVSVSDGVHVVLPMQAALIAAEECKRKFPSEQREVGPLVELIQGDIAQRRQALLNRRRQENAMRANRVT